MKMMITYMVVIMIMMINLMITLNTNLDSYNHSTRTYISSVPSSKVYDKGFFVSLVPRWKELKSNNNN